MTFFLALALAFYLARHSIFHSFCQEQLQRVCGAFLACLAKFQELVPNSYFETVKDEIHSTRLGCNHYQFNFNPFLIQPIVISVHGFMKPWYQQTVHLPLDCRFMNRHADADLMALLQMSVPPADVEKIDLFKAHLAFYVTSYLAF